MLNENQIITEYHYHIPCQIDDSHNTVMKLHSTLLKIIQQQQNKNTQQNNTNTENNGNERFQSVTKP